MREVIGSKVKNRFKMTNTSKYPQRWNGTVWAAGESIIVTAPCTSPDFKVEPYEEKPKKIKPEEE